MADNDEEIRSTPPQRVTFAPDTMWTTSTINNNNNNNNGELSSSPSIMEPPSGRTSDSMRRASALMLDLGEKRSRRSIVDVRDSFELLSSFKDDADPSDDIYDDDDDDDDNEKEELHETYGSISVEKSTSSDPIPVEKFMDEIVESQPLLPDVTHQKHQPQVVHSRQYQHRRWLHGMGQIPAILLACLLNLMEGIPFGVSYFPIGWGSSSSSDDKQDDFPIPHRESLGIRMFLFSTIVGQIVMTFCSKFTNPISLQMVENVPFYHALAYIVMEEQGSGIDALSTLFFIFGLSSVLVGATFYALGALEYGRIVYFFPSHVLVGCIGGIGVFIIITAFEVTLNTTFEFNMTTLETALSEINLAFVTIGFETVLRILDYATHDANNRPRFPLLAPIFFCMITPLFYIGLRLFSISMEDAENAGYFFPIVSNNCANDCEHGWSSMFNEDLFTIWRIVDVRAISWVAVTKSFPTMVALVAFSLIHVPINIPSFGLSTDVDTDMDAELKSHGWSNAASGLFGGLQNYMCYSNSVLYAKSGGGGKISSLLVAGTTCVLYIVGPHVATYIPRCMAGTLLLHIGIDLFLEGVLDSYGNYDNIEYAFIWVITIVMTVHGMTAALIAGIIAAMSTYAAQSIAHQNPIRGVITALTLRSSSWNRSIDALRILEDPKEGRSRILILQLQGHLFFGNVAQITDSMKAILKQKKGTTEEPLVVIMDFTLVVGMDSSAAHGIVKLKKVMHKAFNVEVTVFVTGSGEGFPCEYALSHELSKTSESSYKELEDSKVEAGTLFDTDHHPSMGSISVSAGPPAQNAKLAMASHPKEQVCESLDSALSFAEDLLVARADLAIFRRDQLANNPEFDHNGDLSLDEEKVHALTYLKNLCPNTNEEDVRRLLEYFHREEYKEHEVIWKQGASSCSAKIIIHGTLMSYLEGTNETESIDRGNMLGELGLVHGTDRLTTVVCFTTIAVLYSISKEKWDQLVQHEPHLARLIDAIVIRYLAHRVQHVSNRIFETRCLPI